MPVLIDYIVRPILPGAPQEIRLLLEFGALEHLNASVPEGAAAAFRGRSVPTRKPNGGPGESHTLKTLLTEALEDVGVCVRLSHQIKIRNEIGVEPTQ